MAEAPRQRCTGAPGSSRRSESQGRRRQGTGLEEQVGGVGNWEFIPKREQGFQKGYKRGGVIQSDLLEGSLMVGRQERKRGDPQEGWFNCQVGCDGAGPGWGQSRQKGRGRSWAHFEDAQTCLWTGYGTGMGQIGGGPNWI